MLSGLYAILALVFQVGFALGGFKDWNWFITGLLCSIASQVYEEKAKT